MAYELEDEFGDIIAKARSGGGLSAQRVAQAAGIPAAQLAAMEAYEQAPSEAVCGRLADALGLHAASLWAIATESWAPAPVEPVLAGGAQIRLLPYPPMRVTMYLIGDPESGQALVVDPGAEPERILGTLRGAGWRTAAILITHGDADHVDALADVYRELRVPVWVHVDELAQVEGVDAADIRRIEANCEFSAGPFEIRALQTPGHSAGHTSFALRGAVLAGDAIFAGSAGGTKLGPQYYPEHLASVRDYILALPGETKIFAGHGPPTTVAEERAHNPFFAGEYE